MMGGGRLPGRKQSYVQWQIGAVFIPGADGKPQLLDNGFWKIVRGTGGLHDLAGAGTERRSDHVLAKPGNPPVHAGYPRTWRRARRSRQYGGGRVLLHASPVHGAWVCANSDGLSSLPRNGCQLAVFSS